jgi:hypothetical protein
MRGHQACARKRRYRNRIEALIYKSNREAQGAPPLKVYHCNACEGWHLAKETRANDRP